MKFCDRLKKWLGSYPEISTQAEFVNWCNEKPERPKPKEKIYQQTDIFSKMKLKKKLQYP